MAGTHSTDRSQTYIYHTAEAANRKTYRRHSTTYKQTADNRHIADRLQQIESKQTTDKQPIKCRQANNKETYSNLQTDSIQISDRVQTYS